MQQRGDMEAESSHVGGVRAVLASSRLAPQARALALKAVTQLIAATVTAHSATLADAYVPDTPLEHLPPTKWEPQGVLDKPQPSIEVGVLGGTAPSRGRAMLDTGAGMTIISSAVARAHGIHVRPYFGTFCVASGTHAKLTGEADIDLQVHRSLALKLEGVKVQELGDSYQFLLGADILRGAAGILEEVNVVVGSRVEWVDRRNDARLTTWVINPVGPAGGVGVGGAGPPPKQEQKLPPPPPSPAEEEFTFSRPDPTLLEITVPFATQE